MHMKSCICRNSVPLFFFGAVELVLFYGNLGSANLQLLSRPSCFYFLLHILAFFKHLQFSLLFLLDKNWHYLCCGHVCEAQCASGWGIHLSGVDKIIHLSLSWLTCCKEAHVSACFGLIKERYTYGVSSSSVCICLNLDAVINSLMPEFSTECRLQKTRV
jgi:hypothetical protein